jgi:hypothetical protein
MQRWFFFCKTLNLQRGFMHFCLTPNLRIYLQKKWSTSFPRTAEFGIQSLTCTLGLPSSPSERRDLAGSGRCCHQPLTGSASALAAALCRGLLRSLRRCLSVERACASSALCSCHFSSPTKFCVGFDRFEGKLWPGNNNTLYHTVSS